jgi:predicted dienelactone hydrolase
MHLRFFATVLSLSLGLFCSQRADTFETNPAPKPDAAVQMRQTSLFDSTRHRQIPSAIYSAPSQIPGKLKPAIISHGYGMKDTDYSFIADYLATHGYYVVSIQHEIPGDEPLPMTGDPLQARMPSWERGSKNILFVIDELRKTCPDLDYAQTLLVGHSQGGDTTMLFATEHPDMAHVVISLDNRRMPWPRRKQIHILSIRSSDQVADIGVIPPPEVRKKLGIEVVKLPATIHNDMWDGGTTAQKAEIIHIVDGFLTKGISGERGQVALPAQQICFRQLMPANRSP